MAHSEPADDYRIEYTESGDEAELVVSTDEVTVTVEGQPAEVHRQFVEYQARALHITPAELDEAVDDLPMPDPDDLDSVPADEFYGE